MNQHVRLRPVILLLLAAVVAVFGLVWAMDAMGSESPAADTSAAAAADGGKVIYRVGWTREPDNLSPFVGYNAPAFEIWYCTYDSLVGYDPSTLSPMKGEESTGLATDWTVSDDGLVWTFTLRQNAKWSDGVPLTAKDVAFTYNYIIQNEMENLTAYTRLIEEATALDDYTVEFTCSKPKPDMIRHWVPILPEHIWSKVDPKQAASGKYTNNPPYVGSGPFMAEEWKKSSHVKLVENPTWWGTKKPAIDEIYFMAFTNNDTLLQDLIAGTIDGGVDLTATQMKQLKSEPTITSRAITVDGFDDLGFNCYDGPSKGHPVLKDVKFRQAVNWAVDREKIVSLVWGGTTTAGTTIIPPNYYKDPDWHWEPPAETAYTFDPAKAGQLLEEAGYTDGDGDGIREYKGKNIELGLIAREESVQSQMTGKLIAGWFGDVGIKVNLEVMDEATLGDRELNYEGDVFTPDFDMFLWGWYLDYDPGSMLSYMTKGQIENWNETCWWNEEYDQLYEEQGQELDPAKRKEIIDRMQQILYEESPYIVTDYAPDFEAYNTAKWEGYIQIPSPNGNTLLPPFGNGGYANFTSIQPKVAETVEESSSSTGVWIAVIAAVVVLAIVVVVVVKRRKPETEVD